MFIALRVLTLIFYLTTQVFSPCALAESIPLDPPNPENLPTVPVENVDLSGNPEGPQPPPDFFSASPLSQAVETESSTDFIDSISVCINECATHTNHENVEIKINFSEPLPAGEQLEMAFSQDGINFSEFEAWQSTKAFTLQGNDGPKMIHVLLKDELTNERLIKKEIILDRRAPFHKEIYTQAPAPEGHFIFNDPLQYNFGAILDVMGDQILVGDEGYDSGKGAAFIVRDGKAFPILNPSTEYKHFGNDIVVIDNQHFAVGAASSRTDDHGGVVFLYEVAFNNGVYEYNLVRTLSSPSSARYDLFGVRLAFVNGLLFVGAPSEKNHFLTGEGRVHVFDADSQSPTFGQHLATLDLPEELLLSSTDIRFGDVIKAANNRVYIGAPGRNAISIFDIDRSSSNFGELIDVLSLPAGMEDFAHAFALDGTRLVATAKSSTEGYIVLVMDGDPSSSTFGQILQTLKSPSYQILIDNYLNSRIEVADGKYFVHAKNRWDENRQILVFDGNPTHADYGQLIQIIQGSHNFGLDFVAKDDALYVGMPKEPLPIFQQAKPGQLFKYQNLADEGLVINGGAKYTQNLELELSLDFSDDFSQPTNLKMAFSLDGIHFALEEVYQNQKMLLLPEGPDGFRDVWVKITDEAGNYLIVKNTIALDRTPPQPFPDQPAVLIEDGASMTSKQRLSFRLNTRDNLADISQLKVATSMNGIFFSDFHPLTNPNELALGSQDYGQQTLYVKFRDPAGNESPVYTDSILVDFSAPHGFIDLIYDPLSNDNLKVKIDLSDIEDDYSGLDSMQVMISYGWYGTITYDWEPFQTSKTIYLDPLPGPVLVEVAIRDKVGNIGGSAENIVLPDTVKGFGPLNYRSNGHYELNLNQSFDALRSALQPSNLLDGLDQDALLNLDYSVLMADLDQRLADVFDFVLALPTSSAFFNHLKHFSSEDNETPVLGLSRPEKFDIDGIGLPENDPEAMELNEIFGPLFEEHFSRAIQELLSQGQQQGSALLDVKTIREQITTDSFLDYVLLQLLGHRWGTFLTTQGNLSNDPLKILGADGASWSPFFDAESSPMNGLDWRDNGDGTFTLEKIWGIRADDFVNFVQQRNSQPLQENIFNDFDLYAMGVLPPDQVKPSFVIDTPRLLSGSTLSDTNFFDKTINNLQWLLSDRRIKGTRRNVTINDVIRIEGPRTPSAQLSDKDFSLALVLVQHQGETQIPASSTKVAAESLMRRVSQTWNKATRGLSTLTIGHNMSDFESFKNRVMSRFDDSVIDETQSAELNQNLSEAKSNASKLSELEAFLSQTVTILSSYSELGKSRPDLAAVLNEASNKITNARAKIENLRETYNRLIPDADQILASLSLIDRDELLIQVNRAKFTGMLPPEFVVLFDAYMSLLDQVQKIEDELPLWNDELLNSHETISDAVQEAVSLLSHTFATISDFDLSEITLLANSPNIQVKGLTTSTSSSATRAKVELLKVDESGFLFKYDVASSRTYAVGEIAFPNGQNGALPSEVILGINGPLGAKLKVIFKDAGGKEAVYHSQLKGKLLNYGFSLPDAVPGGFDRTQVRNIQIVVENSGTTSTSAKKGTVEIKVPGLDYAPIIPGQVLDSSKHTAFSGFPVVEVSGGTLSSADAGEVTAFRQSSSEMFEMDYELDNETKGSYAKSSIVFPGGPTSLPDHLAFGFKGPANGGELKILVTDINGVAADFMVLLTGVWQNFALDLAHTSIPAIFDRSHISRIDFVVSAATPSKQYKGTLAVQTKGLKFPPIQFGDFGAVRVSTRYSSGLVSGFQEWIYSSLGAYVYSAERNSIKRDTKTKAVIGYKDTIRFKNGRLLEIAYSVSSGVGKWSVLGRLENNTSINFKIPAQDANARLLFSPEDGSFTVFTWQPNGYTKIQRYNSIGKLLS